MFFLYVFLNGIVVVGSWSDQPLESPPVLADLEDCTRNRYGQHSGGKTQ